MTGGASPAPRGPNDAAAIPAGSAYRQEVLNTPRWTNTTVAPPAREFDRASVRYEAEPAPEADSASTTIFVPQGYFWNFFRIPLTDPRIDCHTLAQWPAMGAAKDHTFITSGAMMRNRTSRKAQNVARIVRPVVEQLERRCLLAAPQVLPPPPSWLRCGSHKG